MKITRIVQQKEDGNLRVTMVLTPEQIAWLVNLALLTLIEKGSVEFEDIERSMSDAEMTDQGEIPVEASQDILQKIES